MPVDINLQLEQKYRYKAAAALHKNHLLRYRFYSTLERYYGIKHEEKFVGTNSGLLKRIWWAIKH